MFYYRDTWNKPYHSQYSPDAGDPRVRALVTDHVPTATHRPVRVITYPDSSLMLYVYK